MALGPRGSPRIYIKSAPHATWPWALGAGPEYIYSRVQQICTQDPQKSAKIGLQDSDGRVLCSTPSWLIMVCRILLSCFNPFWRFLKFCEFFTPGYGRKTSLIFWLVFVGNPSKIFNFCQISNKSQSKYQWSLVAVSGCEKLTKFQKSQKCVKTPQNNARNHSWPWGSAAKSRNITILESDFGWFLPHFGGWVLDGHEMAHGQRDPPP